MLRTANLRTLTAKDWSGSRSVEVNDLPATTTVGDLLREIREVMGLPFDGEFAAVAGGVELRSADTIGDAGLREGETVEITPRVIAG